MLHLYCSLCGVVLSYGGDGLPSSFPLSWHQEIRALSRTLDDDKPVLSGVGFIQQEAYRANFDPPRPYTDPGPLEEHGLPSGSEPTTYLFHDACWRLLPRRVGAELGVQGNEKRTAELVFHLLQCLRKDVVGVPMTPHTFGGISWYRDSYGLDENGYQDSLRDDLKYVMADPRLDLEEEIRESRGKLCCQWQTPQGSPISPETANSQDPFMRLPSEIISLIMEELSIKCACLLRHASRAVASITSPPDLPQSFWEGRFASPFEMYFFFAGDAPPVNRRETDWRALYARVRSSLVAKAPAILNRRRITRCHTIICAALERLLHEGDSDWPPAEPRLAEDVLPGGCRLGRRVGSRDTRRFDAQYLPLSGLGDSSPVTIAVYYIHFNSRVYISGFRVTSSDGDGRTRTICEVGIKTPGRMEHVTLSQGSVVSAVRVYTISGGLVSLEFLSRDASLGRLSTRIGAPLGKYGAVADLCPRDSTRLNGLVVYLDICKCIAVQAVEERLTDDGSNAVEPAELENTTDPPWLPVWVPHAPPYGDVDLVRADPLEVYEPKTSPVLLNINFGGPRGEKLGLLNRVVALLDVVQGAFRGLEFFYDDGTKELHGSRHLVEDAGTRRACVGPSFVVCGKQGERVTEIHVDRGKIFGWTCARRLRFRTNMGSDHSFQVLERNPSGDQLHEVAILKPRGGHVLTGLVVGLTDRRPGNIYLRAFHAFGVVDVPRDDAVEGAAPGDVSTQKVPLQRTIEPYEKRLCCWSSTASLQDVTRIRFSRGRFYQRPRDEKHITGLMFHFRGSERVAIIGQWVAEVDSMDIDDGDRITHIRVYYKPKSRSVSTVPRGRRRASGIVVGTAKGTRKAVLGRDCAETFYADYYANPLEEVDGIIWGFSHRFDRIQIVNAASPRAGNRGLRFPTRPELEESHRETHDLRRFLWTEVDSQGRDVRLSAIEAYFAPDHLSGLRFVYGEGIERSVGHCEGELATLCLAPTEKIGAMAVDVHSENGNALVFHTNLQEAVCLHHPSTEVGLGNDGHTRFQMDKESIIWTPKSEAEELKTRGEVEPPVDARECVGIWVKHRQSRPPKRCIKEVGPIFLEDLSQN